MAHVSHQIAKLTISALAMFLVATGSARAAEVAAAVAVANDPANTPLVTTFAVDAPGTALSGPTPITGLVAGEQPAAIDLRPSTAGLYMLAVGPDPVDSGHLYTLDPLSGVATPIGGGITLQNTHYWDIDFDPVSGRVRALGSLFEEANFRIDPDTGQAILESTTDPFFPPGDPNEGPASVAAGAYTNSLPGATSTTAYALTSTVLAQLGSPGGSPFDPNSGRLTTVGMFTQDFLSAPLEGLDISGSTGRAYVLLVAQLGMEFEMHITEMNLSDASTGPRARPPVQFARDIALLPTSVVRFGAAPTIESVEGGALRVPVERRGPGTGPVNVAWSVSPQTAAEDLSATSGTVSFGQGGNSQSFEIPITDDRMREGPETVAISLGAATGSATEGAVVEPAAQATFTIAASDPAGPRVGIGPKRVRLTSRGRARLRVKCPASASKTCNGTLKLQRRVKGKKRTIAKRKFTVAAGKTARLQLRVSRAGRRALARRGKLRVTALASVRDAVSTAASTRRKLVLLPPR